MTNHEQNKGCGNGVLWTARKTRNRFSIAAHKPLEIADAISTFPQPRLYDRMEKWKSKDRIPTFPRSVYLSQNQKRKEIQPRLLTSSFRLISGLENAPAPPPPRTVARQSTKLCGYGLFSFLLPVRTVEQSSTILPCFYCAGPAYPKRLRTVNGGNPRGAPTVTFRLRYPPSRAVFDET
jgi:hypothetical protein